MSSGAQCNLMAASGHLGLLESHLEDDQSRHLIYHLRQMCLGHNVDEHVKKELQESGLLEKNGMLHPVMKAVVLASVRGEDHALYVVSPFTNRWDRTLADYLQIRDDIRANLSKQEADEILFEKDPVPDALTELIAKRGQDSSDKLTP